MANTKDSLEKPKRKPGRPKKDREKQAADIAEMEDIRAKRMVELSQQRRAELGAEIMAKEQTAMELETTYPKVCPLCGVTFIPTRPNRKYCTERCTRIANRIANARSEQKRKEWRDKAKRTPPSRLDDLDPEDLLHYGRWQSQRTLKGR